MSSKISPQLFEFDPHIRYVAVNQSGNIVEMEQNRSSLANIDHFHE